MLYFLIRSGFGSPSISNFFYTNFYCKIYNSGLTVFFGFLIAFTGLPAYI
jgi:hypothetical protein